MHNIVEISVQLVINEMIYIHLFKMLFTRICDMIRYCFDREILNMARANSGHNIIVLRWIILFKNLSLHFMAIFYSSSFFLLLILVQKKIRALIR